MYSNELVCDIISYINENLFQKIVINDLVDRFHYNRYYIMKLFKRELNITIVDYINSMKIYKSLDQIKSNNSMLNIAIMSGFYSLEYFSETFKHIIGVSPSIYKKFINYDRNISSDNITTITNSLIKLNLLNKEVSMYLSRRYNPINKSIYKTFSIFK